MGTDLTVRVAAVQHPPVLLDRDATIDRAVDLIKTAAAGGARIVAFPETWIPSYPAWIFGNAAWDDPQAKQLHARLRRESVTIGSEATDRLCAAARADGVHVVMGLNERDGAFSRGTLYNSQLFINPAGEILGVHRKLVPTHAERIVWGMGDGSTLHVFDTEIGRLGGLICWEHWMPLTRFAMHALGEEIHVASWPDLPDEHDLASRSYAFEGRCYVIVACPAIGLEDVPEELHDIFAAGLGAEGEGALLVPGGSGVIGPDGRWQVGPVFGEKTIVYADLDLSVIGGEHQALDSAGHYNRPDVFQLSIDRRARPQVTWHRDAAVDDSGSPAAGAALHDQT